MKLQTRKLSLLILIGLFLGDAVQYSPHVQAESVKPWSETSHANWPDTNNNLLRNFSKVSALDFSQTYFFGEEYAATPHISNDTTLQLYIHGKQVDLSTMPIENRSRNTIFRTDQLGEDTYILATNALQVWDQTKQDLKALSLKVTLQSQDLGDTSETTIGLGLDKRNFLQVGGGMQSTERGNFLHMNYQILDEKNKPVPLKLHLGYTDIDFDEAIKLQNDKIDKIYVSKDSILPYELSNDVLAITRDYGDPTDKNDTPETRNHVVLFDLSVPSEGINVSISTSRAKKEPLYPGGQVAPSMIPTLKYVGYQKTHFVDENGQKLLDPISTKGDTGSPFSVHPKTIKGYKLVSEKTKGIESGSYGDGDLQELTYVYKKVQGQVNIHYVDESGHSLLPEETTIGDEGEAYTTTPKDIDNYELVLSPDNQNGVFIDGIQEVTYVYKKKVREGKVTVEYIDEDGNTLAHSQEKTGKEGESYQTSPKEIEGYELIQVPENQNGEFTPEEQRVTYIYRKKEKAKGNVITKFVDRNGVELSEATKETFEIDTTYQTTPKEIPDYTIFEYPSNQTGTVVEGDTTVTYVYDKVVSPRRTPSGKINIKHIDEEGNLLPGSQVNIKEGKVGDSYSTAPLEIEGYELIQVPQNKEGIFEVTEQSITYVYRKILVQKEGVVHVQYVDEQGKELAFPETLSDQVGRAYDSVPKEIEGYKLIQIPMNQKGKFTEEEQRVVYVYKKIKDQEVETPPAPEKGRLIVRHVDELGRLMPHSKEIHSQGEEGQQYTTEGQSFSGYELVKVPDNKEGKYISGQEQVVTYVYKKLPLETPHSTTPPVGDKPKKEESSDLKKLPQTSKVQQSKKVETKKELPKAGEAHSSSLSGLGLLLMSSLFGYLMLRYKK